MSLARCLTTKTRIDAETETLIPTRGGGFDVATLDGLDTARTLTRRYDSSPCADRGPDVVAFAQNTRDEVRLQGGDGQIVGALAAEQGMKQTTYIAFDTTQITSPQNGSNPQPLMAGGPVGGNQGGDFVTQTAVRRLTSVECERLQGFPDGFTAIPWRGKPADQCPDGPRYKALGNSMAVPVMAWIGERIQKVEELKIDR